MLPEYRRLEAGYGLIIGRLLSTLKGKLPQCGLGRKITGPFGGTGRGEGEEDLRYCCWAPVLGAGDDLVPRALMPKTIGALETVWVLRLP